MLRNILIGICLLFCCIVYGQHKQEPNRHKEAGGGMVCVSGVFDMKRATKDGFYFNNYVVEISAARAKEFNGERVQIRGALFIEKGLPYDTGPIRQGRPTNTKHIRRPVITLIQ